MAACLLEGYAHGSRAPHTPGSRHRQRLDPRRAIPDPDQPLPHAKTSASSHPHGIRPGGEGGTTPALGVLFNALGHALQGLGVRHIDMPAIPERVWRAIEAAERSADRVYQRAMVRLESIARGSRLSGVRGVCRAGIVLLPQPSPW